MLNDVSKTPTVTHFILPDAMHLSFFGSGTYRGISLDVDVTRNRE
jgi:hypothetical protein